MRTVAGAGAFALALLLAACSAAPTAPPPTSAGARATPAAPSSNGPRVDACDVSAVPGWPKPGRIATAGFVPVLVSSERLVGRSRLVWSLVDEKNKPIAAADRTIEIGWFDLCADAEKPVEVTKATFAWGITNVRGFYLTTPTFSHAGTWGAAVIMTDGAGKQSGAKVTFQVTETGTTPAVGSTLAPVRTRTLDDVGGDVRKLSSDQNPNPDFYRLSVDEALAQHLPFVLAMATPAFCTSAECGPTLDHLKRIVEKNPITVINVEPYVLDWIPGANDGAGRLQPVTENGAFKLVEATQVYGVPTEPWIFVIDAKGTVIGSFEAVVSDEEMGAAIAAALASAK